MKNFYIILLFVASEFIPLIAMSTTVWNQKPNLPTVGRHRGTGLAIANKGYIGLGHVNGTGVNVAYSDWWEYDPATSSWTQKADYPTENYGAAAFSTKTAAYVGCGVFQNEEFYKFDPILNTWVAIADAPVNVSDNVAFCIGKYGYISTGSDIYEYDTEFDSWTQKQSPPTNINIWSSATVLQNSAFVKTGSNFYEYKPASDSWISKTSYPGLVTSGGVSFSVDNKCYFLLGYSGSLGNVFKEMWEYDPATNNWTIQPEFPGTSRRFACAFSINNIGYVGIGTNGINFNDFWEYNRILSNSSIYSNKENSINTFPCPATNYITFDISNLEVGKLFEITIYNFIGEKIKETTCLNQNCTLQLTNIPAGAYLYSVKNNNSIISTGQFLKR